MKACSTCRTPKELHEFHKNKSAKDSLQNSCKVCRGKAKKKFCSEKRELHNKQNRETNKRHPEKNRLRAKKYNLAYPEKVKIISKKHRLKNPNAAIEWRRNNPEKQKGYNKKNQKLINAHSARRRRAKHQKISFLFTKALQEFYKNCPEGFEVDHIIPLNHKLITGLHVPWNLQYLLKIENRRKASSFDGTWENDSWRKRVKQSE